MGGIWLGTPTSRGYHLEEGSDHFFDVHLVSDTKAPLPLFGQATLAAGYTLKDAPQPDTG